MKTLLFGLFATAIVVSTGCDRGGTSGGPGATNPTAKPPLMGQAEDTFSLTASSLTVTQNSTVDGTIGIKRGKNFAQDVTLSFAELPSGVTMTPTSHVIKAGAEEAKFTLHAADAAALGTFTVKLTGHPATGADATNQMNLTIAKMESFTLGVPLLATTLKQGEAKVVSISVGRGTKFDQDVALRFEGLPKGVTVDPATPSVANADREMKVTFKAAEDASLGDFTVKVIGHPKTGPDVSKDISISVTKK